MTSFVDRMVGAARLRSDIYEEVEADKGAMGQAIAVVVLSSIAAGIGLGAITKGGPSGIVLGVVAALVGWFIWAFLTYFIGTRLLPEPETRSDMGELLRTIGFSSTPGLIRIFGIVPGMSGIVFFISSVWMFAAMVIGVRQALDYKSTLRAVGVCFIGWLVQALIFGVIFYISGRQAL